MSVVQRRAPQAVTSLAIVCDSCVDELAGPASVPMNWHTLWTRARNHGWQGTNHPFGPHRCAGCSATPTRPR